MEPKAPVPRSFQFSKVKSGIRTGIQIPEAAYRYLPAGSQHPWDWIHQHRHHWHELSLDFSLQNQSAVSSSNTPSSNTLSSHSLGKSTLIMSVGNICAQFLYTECLGKWWCALCKFHCIQHFLLLLLFQKWQLNCRSKSHASVIHFFKHFRNKFCDFDIPLNLFGAVPTFLSNQLNAFLSQIMVYTIVNPSGWRLGKCELVTIIHPRWQNQYFQPCFADKFVTEITILHEKSGNETIFITAKNERLL